MAVSRRLGLLTFESCSTRSVVSENLTQSPSNQTSCFYLDNRSYASL